MSKTMSRLRLHSSRSLKESNKAGRLRHLIFPSDGARATARLTSDTLLCGLEALKESSDAFPPLKSAVCGIMFIVNHAKKSKANKAAVEGIYRRIDEIQDSLVRAVPDVGDLSPAQQRAIEAFDGAVQLVCKEMESMFKQGRLSRFVRAGKHNDKLGEFARRLGDADATFTSSPERTLLQSIDVKANHVEVKVARIEDRVEQGLHRLQALHAAVLRQ
ncbi:hypothetical protein OF83DRAFT_1082190 [Amylostereum chailletii]|nr:hypothetical protein OF83DRAFT_1082190 [Amylostereum chailletii]